MRRTLGIGLLGAALLAGLLGAALFAGCGGDEDTVSAPPPSAPEKITLTSPAFDGGGTIPKRFTCDGGDVSPPLEWSGVPREARELALLVEDPDAPGGTFVHWILTGIEPGKRSLGEGEVPPGATQNNNSFGEANYRGPCPPKGDEPHRYVFTLYALRRGVAVEAGASPEEVRSAIGESALARGRLTGRYGR